MIEYIKKERNTKVLWCSYHVSRVLNSTVLPACFYLLNKTKDQLWSMNEAQPVGNLIRSCFSKELAILGKAFFLTL